MYYLLHKQSLICNSWTFAGYQENYIVLTEKRLSTPGLRH